MAKKRAGKMGVALTCFVMAGCAAAGPKTDAGDNPRVQAVLKGWDRCMLFSSMNEMKSKKAAAEIVDTSMALCRDEEGRYEKELLKAGVSPQDAAEIARSEHQTMRQKYLAMYGG